jgi:hypothetical protein
MAAGSAAACRRQLLAIQEQSVLAEDSPPFGCVIHRHSNVREVDDLILIVAPIDEAGLNLAE